MDTEKIGRFIKEQRTAAKLTQKELAEKLGCTDKAVSRWETGRGMPDISFVIPLSQVLDVSVGELIAGEKYIGPHVENTPDSEPAENANNSGTIESVIKKSDETLVNVMTENKKEVRRLNFGSVFTILACCLEVFFFFGLPALLPDTAPVISYIIVATAVVSALVGLSGNRPKWFFPLFIFLMLFFVNIMNPSPEGMGAAYIGAYFAAGSLIIVALFSLLRLLLDKRKAKKTI